MNNILLNFIYFIVPRFTCDFMQVNNQLSICICENLKLIKRATTPNCLVNVRLPSLT